MNAFHEKTIKAIVTADYRAAAIFEKYSIDFCCKGGITIDQACSQKGLDPSVVFAELAQYTEESNVREPHFSQWPMDELIGYIVNVHHGYVRQAIPIVSAHTRKVASVHGDCHPEVINTARQFETVARDLTSHMMKEEQVLFPYIKAMVDVKRNGGVLPRPPFGTVENAIRMMEADHQAAGEELFSIRSSTGNYAPPGDACTTFRVCLKELQQFEMDLHQHVHLENNILFPQAITLEQELTRRITPVA